MLLSLMLPGLGISLIIYLIYQLYPKPYPGIPYNQASAKRITGDIPELIPLIKATNEFSDNLFTVTTRNLGTPIAQLLFPGLQRPLIIIDDPREIEDICVRRNTEFDIAPMEVEISGRMFPNSPLSQYTTPELRAHKRRWADTVSHEFIRGTVSELAYKATLELVKLWRLRAYVNKDRPFMVLDDLENSTLDTSLKFTVAEDGGMTRSEITKLQRQIDGDDTPIELPRGLFIKRELMYLTDTIARNTLSPSPKWAQILATYTPRFRKSRRIIKSEIGRAIGTAVQRLGSLNLDESKTRFSKKDTCMIDLVLRRHILEAESAGVVLPNPTENQKLIDETFVMICAVSLQSPRLDVVVATANTFQGFDSVANTLAWFLKFMEANPSVQNQLRAVLQAAFPGPDLPSVQQILDSDIPYLSGTCEEAVRLAGAAKAQVRQAIVDTEVLGCPIPKGAQLFLNLHIDRAPAPIHESKRSLSSQAAAARLGDGIKGARGLASFDPGRWLVKSEKGTEAFHAQALPSTAFGGGFRGCFGTLSPSSQLPTLIFP